MTIAAEAGKPVKTARVEAQRCVGTLAVLGGRGPQADRRDGADGGRRRPARASSASCCRVPYGVVGAISPFNFPLNLVAHKLGPSIAAGNATVLKPAGQTPISRDQAGRDPLRGGAAGELAARDHRPGLRGRQRDRREPSAPARSPSPAPRRSAGTSAPRSPHKKVNLELGSTAPLIVNEDGDWETAADKAQLHAFSHAGQSCISIQRILLHEVDRRRLHPALRRERREAGRRRPDGREHRRRPADLRRRTATASRSGSTRPPRRAAEMLTGGELVDEGRCLAPDGACESRPRDAKVWCEEIFGPVATIHTFGAFDEALELANDAKFGLQAGVFTREIGRGLEAGERLEFGGVLDQRGADLPHRPDALRRRQGLRQHPRGPRLRRARADRGAPGHPAGLRLDRGRDQRHQAAADASVVRAGQLAVVERLVEDRLVDALLAGDLAQRPCPSWRPP